jgi:hypothetical protein
MATQALAEQLYLVDPVGDITLVLKDGFKVKVSSKTLSLASPHLREVLDGVSGEAYLTHEDENPEAVRLLVEIFHFKPPSINDITVPFLGCIATICTLWKCSAALGAYKELWMVSHWKPGSPENGRLWRDWLKIGSAFDRPDVIKEAMKDKVQGGWKEWSAEEINSYAVLAGWDDNIVGRHL